MNRFTKIAFVFGLLFFGSFSFADGNVTEADKVLYGNKKDETAITQKDIDNFKNQGYKEKTIKVVSTLYKIALDNWEIIFPDDFKKLLKIQSKNRITTKYLYNELGFTKNTITDIKNNNFLNKIIKFDWKSLSEVIADLKKAEAENEAAKTENEAAKTENEAAKAENEAAKAENEAAKAENEAAKAENAAAHKRKNQMTAIMLWQ